MSYALIQSTGGSSAAFDPTSSKVTMFEDFCHYTLGSQVGVFALYYQGASIASDGPTSSEKNKLGVVKISTNSANTSGGYFSEVGQFFPGGATYSWSHSVQLSAAPTGTDDYLLRIGLSDGYTGTVNGAWFLIDRTKSTTNWYAVTSNGGTATFTSTGTAIGTSWVNLRIEFNAAASSVGFYINGTLVATNTTNIPAAGIGPWMYLANVASAVTKSVRLDWLKTDFTPTASRGTY